MNDHGDQHTALSPAFRRRVLDNYDLSERDLDRLVEDLVDHWSETIEDFVRRRHRELQHQGLAVRRIYPLLTAELRARPFAARPRSERQIRRILYG